jgi:PAS domain S-box-containing protein
VATSSCQSDIQSFLFRNNPVPMFLYNGRSLRILRANDAATSRYGYTAREFRTMTIRHLRRSEDASALESALHIDHDAPSLSLWTHVTRSGAPFAVEIRILPFVHRRHNLCLMSAIDASAWSEDRLKLVRSEELHRSLVEKSPFGIYRLDFATSRFEQANPVLLRNIGYSLEELSSIDLTSLYVEPADRSSFLAELRANGSVYDFETRFRKKDGGIVRVSISGHLCSDSATGRRYIQGYVLDITHQRELEERLSHTHRIEAVGRLAGGVAHDFNNISQSISLACELALRSQIAPEVASKLNEILQQTSRAAEITHQLLAFSRRQVLQPRVVNLNDCINKAAPMLARAVGVDIAIDLNLDENVDPIFVDPDQLTLVLMHLADNARAAMPQGGRLQISTASCPGDEDPVHGKHDGPCVSLTVADTGVGMDESVRRRIFEPFFSTKNTPLTSGLGLSTVHGVIRQSKGHIKCVSTPGHGTIFHILLPIAVAKPPAECLPLPGVVDGSRVLLAEDDTVIRKNLTCALRLAGVAVDSVSSGDEALSAFARNHYDVVITDIIMPKLGGIELTRRLRQLDPALPIVLTSGYAEEISVLRDLPQNSIAYLQKPFALPELIATVHGLLSRRAAETQTAAINHDLTASPQ